MSTTKATEPTWPKAPNGDYLFTGLVVTSDGSEVLVRSSGKTISAGAQHIYEEVASDYTQELGEGEELDDSAYEAEISYIIDNMKSLKMWAGHHDSVPATPPLHTED